MKTKLRRCVWDTRFAFGTIFKGSYYSHQLRVFSRARIRRRRKLCYDHITIKDVLRRENGKWIKLSYIAVDGLIIRNYNGDDNYIKELRERYYRLHKHTIFERR